MFLVPDQFVQSLIVLKGEPQHLRPADDSLRAVRFAERIRPYIHEPGTRWTIVRLSESSPRYDANRPGRVLGHAGWILPERTKNEILNFFRVDASELLGWREKMGWTKEYEDELWSGINVESRQKSSVEMEDIRRSYMEGIGHWWVSPNLVSNEHADTEIGQVFCPAVGCD